MDKCFLLYHPRAQNLSRSSHACSPGELKFWMNMNNAWICSSVDRQDVVHMTILRIISHHHQDPDPSAPLRPHARHGQRQPSQGSTCLCISRICIVDKTWNGLHMNDRHHKKNSFVSQPCHGQLHCRSIDIYTTKVPGFVQIEASEGPARSLGADVSLSNTPRGVQD